MGTSIFLWVLGIHIFEIIGYLIYLLFRRNSKLEEAIRIYQKQNETISYVFSEFNAALDKVNEKIYIEQDPELVVVFDKLKELQNTIEII